MKIEPVEGKPGMFRVSNLDGYPKKTRRSIKEIFGMFEEQNVNLDKYDILDTCCGSKMFWLGEDYDNVLFCDIREESHVLCDGRDLDISPDIQIDFRDMPFPDSSFRLVVFDPPHLKSLGKDSWMAKKYGRLFPTWEDDIRQGFKECFRVLEYKGILIFKWNETQIPVSDILELTDKKPLFGHVSGKASNTHWITFMKL